MALVSIPEGMAYALVAGVNPICGLCTGIVTTIVASLTASTSLLVVPLTNAMALVAGEQLARLSTDADPIRALCALTLLVGVIMFALGALELGTVIRFVSREVMSGVGFSTASLVVLGQYKDLVGYASTLDTNKLFKAVDITLHLGNRNVPATVVGLAAIAVLVVLKRSPLKNGPTSSSSCWRRSLCSWSGGSGWVIFRRSPAGWPPWPNRRCSISA